MACNDGRLAAEHQMVSCCLNDPWEDDTRHVKRAAVAQIMTAFEAAFAKPV